MDLTEPTLAYLAAPAEPAAPAAPAAPAEPAAPAAPAEPAAPAAPIVSPKFPKPFVPVIRTAHQTQSTDVFCIAQLVEHAYGWTIRVERYPAAYPTRIHEEFPIVNAIMPNAGRFTWQLPRLSNVDTSLYPTLALLIDDRVYLVAVIVQPRSLVSRYYDTSGLASFDKAVDPTDAKMQDHTQFAFFSETYSYEWNTQALLYGEPFEPLVNMIVSKYEHLWSMPKSTEPVVVYHGTTSNRAQSIETFGFQVSRECANLSSSVANDPSQLPCLPHSCRCRMMGPGVYGTSFTRALSFAATRLAPGKRDREHHTAPEDLGIVRFAIRPGPTVVATPSVCLCGCKYMYVDHVGAWQARAQAIIVRPHCEPASKYFEMCIASAQDCLVLGHSIYERKFSRSDRFEAAARPRNYERPYENNHTHSRDRPTNYGNSNKQRRPIIHF